MDENGNLYSSYSKNKITKNRLHTVCSKIGKLDFANEERMKEIRNSYIEDVFQDFDENTEQILDILTTTT